MSMYQDMAKAHPKLERGKVWCRTCGRSEKTSTIHNLQHGWPKCCRHTMTIDSPEEQAEYDKETES